MMKNTRDVVVFRLTQRRSWTTLVRLLVLFLFVLAIKVQNLKDTVVMVTGRKKPIRVKETNR